MCIVILFFLKTRNLSSFLPFKVIVAVLPQTHMSYFDVEEKVWRQLSSLAPALPEATNCYCAEVVGRELFVSGKAPDGRCYVYCYDIETNKWHTHEDTHSYSAISNLCAVSDYMYALPWDLSIPQRYSLAKHRWQSFSKIKRVTSSPPGHCPLYNSATVHYQKLYALCGNRQQNGSLWLMQNATLYCFDRVNNMWQEKSSTCNPHFGSSLFVVNDRLCVAGGRVATRLDNTICGEQATVEVYDEENNKWSVVEQNRIPQNNLGAVEIEGRVYFIINKFPVDSGIRIPSGEVYPVYLGDWKNLGNVDKNAALCYVPLKRDSVKGAENT